MTILSPEVLSTVLDLVEAGASVVETTAAIGCAPKSKIIFTWLKASADAGEFGALPDAASPWCIVRDENPPEWFHVLFAKAKADGRVTRSIRVTQRVTPMRADLEARLAAKRGERAPAPVAQHVPPRMIVERVSSAPVMVESPPAPRPPTYVRSAPSIEGHHGENGPPSEGRFRISADRPKSYNERRAGTIEITDEGIRQW